MALSNQTSVLRELSDIAAWLGMISVSTVVAIAFMTSVRIGVSAYRYEIRSSSCGGPRFTKVARRLTDIVIRDSSRGVDDQEDESAANN